MRRIGGNDLIELLALGLSDDRANPARMMHHERQFPDLRAKYVFDFLRSWGYAAAFGDVLSEFASHCHSDTDQPAGSAVTESKAPPSPTELAMRACEIVDAAWSELTHRGWIVQQPSLSDE